MVVYMTYDVMPILVAGDWTACTSRVISEMSRTRLSASMLPEQRNTLH